MIETLKVTLTYDSDAEKEDLKKDAMLFALDLEDEARKHQVKLACRLTPKVRKLDLLLAGTSESVEKFIRKLNSKNIDYSSVNDYQVGASTPYKGREPDWEYHNSLVAMRSAYLRTAYMTDVRHLGETSRSSKAQKNICLM